MHVWRLLYQGHLLLSGLSRAAADTAHASVAGGLAVARAAGSPAWTLNVRDAFTSGLDVMLWACAGIAVAAALLAFVFLPRQAGSAEPAAGESPAARIGQAAGAE